MALLLSPLVAVAYVAVDRDQSRHGAVANVILSPTARRWNAAGR